VSALLQRCGDGVGGSWSSAATPKRRRVSMAVVFGLKGDPALDLRGSSFLFLLDGRIFSDLGMAFIPSASPSGILGHMEQICPMSKMLMCSSIFNYTRE
jgi:hypothetical protein